MLITAFLTTFVLYSLFVGTLPGGALAAVCILSAGFFLLFGGHSHGDVLVIDLYARRSRFSGENAACKVVGCITLLILCVAARSPWPPLVLFVLMAALTVTWGGLPLHDYLALFSLPAVFLLLSGVTLLWDYSPAFLQDNVVSIGFFSGQLLVTQAAQQTARLVIARALGAVSCLYFLSLSTPMPEIISVLRKAHVPAVVIELAVLIYRYIFILLSTYRSMKDAAESRLGYSSYRRRLRTAGLVYGNLLARSFRRAGAYYDAMESRCYNGELRFLERKKPMTIKLAVLFGLLNCGMLAALLMSH